MSKALPGRERLLELARQRAKLQPVESAALAYARWQGLTDETNVDTAAAKTDLDQLTDNMEPEQWVGLNKLIGTLDDHVLSGLMAYSIKRTQEQMREQAVELANPTPAKQRKSPKRDKDR